MQQLFCIFFSFSLFLHFRHFTAYYADNQSFALLICAICNNRPLKNKRIVLLFLQNHSLKIMVVSSKKGRFHDISRIRVSSKMTVCQFCDHAPPWSALDESFHDEERFVDLFHRA